MFWNVSDSSFLRRPFFVVYFCLWLSSALPPSPLLTAMLFRSSDGPDSCHYQPARRRLLARHVSRQKVHLQKQQTGHQIYKRVGQIDFVQAHFFAVSMIWSPLAESTRTIVKRQKKTFLWPSSLTFFVNSCFDSLFSITQALYCVRWGQHSHFPPVQVRRHSRHVVSHERLHCHVL
jgi:hypothetical protein